MYEIQVENEKGEWLMLNGSVCRSLEDVWGEMYWAVGDDGVFPKTVLIGRKLGTENVPRGAFPRSEPLLSHIDSVEYRGEYWGAMRWLAGSG